MIRQFFVAVVAVGTLAGASAGSASAATGITALNVGPPVTQWRLQPEGSAGAVDFQCSPCSVPDSVAGYSNRYDGTDTPPVVEANVLGASFQKWEDGNLVTGTTYTTGNTQYLVVKHSVSSFFFERVGGVGAITFSFINNTLGSHVSATPIPAALGLLLTGLAGLFGLKRYRQRQGDGAVPA